MLSWLLPEPLRLRISRFAFLSLAILLAGNCVPDEGLAEYKGKKEIVVGELVTLEGPAGSAWKITPRELGSNTKQTGSSFTFAIRADKVPTSSVFVENLKIVQLEGGGQGIDYDEWEYVVVAGPAPPAPPTPVPPTPPTPQPPAPSAWLQELKGIMLATLFANPPPKAEATLVASIIREKVPSGTDIATLMTSIREARLAKMKAERFTAWTSLIEPVGIHIETLQSVGTIKTLDDQKAAMLAIAEQLDAWASSSTIAGCDNPNCDCSVCECDVCRCKRPFEPSATAAPDPTDAKLDKLIALMEKNFVEKPVPTPALPQKSVATTAPTLSTPTTTYSTGQTCYTLPNGQRVCTPASQGTTTYYSTPGRIIRWGR